MRTKKCVFILLAAMCSIILFGSGLDAKNLYGSKFTLKSLNVDNLNVESMSAENFIANSDASSSDYILSMYSEGFINDPVALKSYGVDISVKRLDNGFEKVDFGLVNIVRSIDEISPKMCGLVYTGRPIQELIIEATLPQLDVFVYQIILNNVRVRSVSSTMSKQDGMLEVLEISYSEMHQNYNIIRPDGTVGGAVSEHFNVDENYQ